MGTTEPARNLCSVDGCERVRRSSGSAWCEAHYYRVRRSGSLGTEPIRTYGDPPPCAVDECDRNTKGGAYGYCSLHYRRFHVTGDPVGMKPMTGHHNPNWLGNNVGYYGAHSRIRKARGPASDYVCGDGCGRQARQWSVVRTDGKLMPWSPDPGDYRPLCVSCHKTYDMAALKVADA